MTSKQPKRKRIMNIYFIGKRIGYDLGKKPRPIFVLIGILSDVINSLASLGFQEEKQRYSIKLKGGKNKHGNN